MRFLRCNALSRCNAYTGRALGALVSNNCLEHVASAVRRHDRTTEVELFEDEAVGPPELTRNTLTEYPHSPAHNYNSLTQYPHRVLTHSALTRSALTARSTALIPMFVVTPAGRIVHAAPWDSARHLRLLL